MNICQISLFLKWEQNRIICNKISKTLRFLKKSLETILLLFFPLHIGFFRYAEILCVLMNDTEVLFELLIQIIVCSCSHFGFCLEAGKKNSVLSCHALPFTISE